MQIEVSKLDVARRQLDTAIKLFFYDADFVSVHTLAAASFNVLNDISRQAGDERKSMRDQLLSCVIEDKKKWFTDQLRKTENFFKHADRDPDDCHTFDPRVSTLFLFDAVQCYSKITGEHTLLTLAYFLWFVTEHPDIFVHPDEYRQVLSDGSNLLQGMPKSMFFEAMIPVILKRGFASGIDSRPELM